ncbi:MAG: glycosyltransferase family 2 protein [Bdellovibrionales bacterium]|nr:glycosyltransferase family 2 protein [Bdellovibrionales bacterium]
MTRKKVLCVVPCYNESENLPNLFRDISDVELAKSCDFLFIDDHSRDNTSELIKSNGFNVIRHEINLGYGGAVKTGLKYAIDQHYKFFVLFPGDHQRQATDVLRLIDHQAKTQSDVVVGSKFHICSKKYGPIGRRLGNRIYSTIARVFWGSPIEDVLSGFKIYYVPAIAGLIDYLPGGYPLDIVFSYYASLVGLKMTEINVACRYDKGTTKMRSIILVSMKMMTWLLIHMIIKPKPKADEVKAIRFQRESNGV